MVNGSRYYRVLEKLKHSISFVYCSYHYPCQIRVHQCWHTKLQLPTSRKKEWRTVHPRWLPVNTVIHTTSVGLEPTTFRLLVDCCSDALQVVPRHRLTTYCSQSMYACLNKWVFSSPVKCLWLMEGEQRCNERAPDDSSRKRELTRVFIYYSNQWNTTNSWFLKPLDY